MIAAVERAPIARNTVHPCFLEPAVIPGLPEHLRTVPSDPGLWRVWQQQVRAYRELIRRKCLASEEMRQVQYELCRRDPVYFMTMFGVVFEPRDVEGRQPEWIPFIPFHFQVQYVRWIEHVAAQDALGRGDGITEKSREMGATWIFCMMIAHHWLFWPVFTCGCLSRRKEDVDSPGATGTIFSKIRATLGIERGIPDHLRLPSWFLPRGFDPEFAGKHNKLNMLIHPTRTNNVRGEATTEHAGVSERTTWRFNDELARFREARSAWGNQQATTFHRFGISSADMASGQFFYNLARAGEAGLNKPNVPAPSFARLDYWLHPFHTEAWLENERSRADDPVTFAREYEIDYFAGQGDYVYHRALAITPGAFPYEPRLGALYCIIDPGTSDPCAVVWVQEDRANHRYRVVEAFQNDGTEDAEFIASVLVGIPISNAGYDYGKYPELLAIMEWTYGLTVPVTYYGDPAGNARAGEGKRSFFDALRDKSGELTHKRHVVTVRTLTSVPSALDTDRDVSARTHATRKLNTLKLLPRLDVHESPGPVEVLTALQRSRYPELKDTTKRTTPRLEPIHDEFSHFRSCVEFFANHVVAFEASTTAPRDRKPVRKSLGGKKL